ncbi:MAG: hypothetical protein OEU26_23940 [Candidatus Tectomicrobia bacterium]|nr:hypothetical protein [Candidatus Tectomicrobia bacterium]
MTIWTQLGKQLLKLAALDYCPVYIFWWPFSPLTPMQRIRRTASRYQFAPYPLPRRVLLRGLLLMTWPVRVIWLSWASSHQLGPRVAERTGKRLWRQRLELLGLAFVRFVPPTAYYRYALYQEKGWLVAVDYLHNHEREGLGRALNAPPPDEAINDKLQFARVCMQHGISSVPVLAVADRHGMVSLEGTPGGQLPRDHLFVKPARGLRGEGSLHLRWVNSGHYQRQDGSTFSPQELTAYLLRLGREQTYLVQPCLTNHPALVTLTNGALATARIVTGRMPDGEIVIIAATLKLPFDQAITSTYGLHSTIDLDAGTSGKGYQYTPLSPGVDVHPDTKSRITGKTVPDWSRACQLVHQVHRNFTTYVFLGWDIAFTATGPVVLEGNVGWDVPTVQMPEQKPLGQTRFIEVCIAHLQPDGKLPNTPPRRATVSSEDHKEKY